MIVMTPGEVIDRWTILRMKASADADYFRDELERYAREAMKYLTERTVIEHAMRIMEMNAKIWMLEASIRNGDEDDFNLDEIGRRALAIRDLNKMRVTAKREIDKCFGKTGDKKVDHRSE